MATKAKTSNGTVNRISDALDVPATMKPQIVVFKITGISPLLQNNPAEFIGKVEEIVLGPKKTYVDADEARMRCYLNSDGQFVHPTQAFIKSMLRAVTGKKFGKLSAPNVVKGAVFIVEPSSVILDDNRKPAKQYAIDRQPCVVGKARILRCRPCWFPWAMNVALDIDTALVSPDHIRDALSLAGRTVGLGDYRPEKGGGYGRFKCE